MAFTSAGGRQLRELLASRVAFQSGFLLNVCTSLLDRDIVIHNHCYLFSTTKKYSVTVAGLYGNGRVCGSCSDQIWWTGVKTSLLQHADREAYEANRASLQHGASYVSGSPRAPLRLKDGEGEAQL